MIKKYSHESIPPFFYNYNTNSPFTKCTLCDGDLTEAPYVIEKHLKHNIQFGTNEIVYEYAVCNACLSQKQGDISDESMASIQKLMAEHQHHLLMKLEYLHSTEKYQVESWIEKCSFTGLPANKCSSFSVSALIENHQLIFEQTPLMVSDVFQEKMQEVLSKETKESFDGLKDKILDGSPSVEDIIGTPTVGIF